MKTFYFIIFMLLALPCLAGDLGFKEAAAKYGSGIPLFAEVLEAISWVESQHDPAAICKNVRTLKSGRLSVSYDRTHMQINDHYWKRQIDQIDSRLWDKMLSDPKTATKVGAWILAKNIKRYGNNWDAIAAYNTGRAIDLEDCMGDKERVERGRQYATKVFNYLASNGHLPSKDQSLARIQGKATAPVIRARTVTPALPMRQTINIADYRESGSWRLVQ